MFTGACHSSQTSCSMRLSRNCNRTHAHPTSESKNGLLQVGLGVTDALLSLLGCATRAHCWRGVHATVHARQGPLQDPPVHTCPPYHTLPLSPSPPVRTAPAPHQTAEQPTPCTVSSQTSPAPNLTRARDASRPHKLQVHFKTKFCERCRDGIMVPLARVRALSAELAACFVNKRSEGIWNHAPASMGGGHYRIVNNTVGCIGPYAKSQRQPQP